MTHTPGPWFIRDDEWDNGVDHYSISTGPDILDSAICSLSIWDKEHTEERMANANLIAAAPDMLEALKAALPHIECSNPEQSGIITMCGKAIAKAEGKQ